MRLGGQNPVEEPVRGIGGLQNMLVQIALNYQSAPDVRTLDVDELRFLYDGLRPTLLVKAKG